MDCPKPRCSERYERLLGLSYFSVSGLGYFLFARRYLENTNIVSFPSATKLFQFAEFPSYYLYPVFTGFQ